MNFHFTKKDLMQSMHKNFTQDTVKKYKNRIYSVIESELQSFMVQEVGLSEEHVLKGNFEQYPLDLKMESTSHNGIITENYYFEDILILVLKRYEDLSAEVYPVWRNEKERG